MNRLHYYCNPLLGHRCKICERSTNQYICWRCHVEIIDLNVSRCLSCYKQLDPVADDSIQLQICMSCQLQPKSYNRRRFLWRYNGNAKHYLQVMKYSPSLYLCKLAACKLKVNLNRLFPPEEQNWDILIPVPAAPKNLASRKFQQSYIIARIIKSSLSARLLTILIPQDYPVPKAKLNRKLRTKINPRQFKINCSGNIDLQNKRILLIDDIYTSGTTIINAILALQKFHCRQIDVLTLANSNYG